MISVPLPALTRGLSSLDCARDDPEALEGSPFDCTEALETAAVRTATEPTTIKGSHDSTKARNNVDLCWCLGVFVATTAFDIVAPTGKSGRSCASPSGRRRTCWSSRARD